MLENDAQRRRRFEAYIDQGRGACSLRRPEVAREVERTLQYYHDEHYDFRAWVIMPNHVHVMLKVRTKPLGRIVGGWKSFTTVTANRLLHRTGSFWYNDYWDTYIRNENHEFRIQSYIDANPVNTGLVREARDWPWSSARFRDAYGRLCF